MGIFILKQCWRFCAEVSVEAVPRNTKKAKKARNTKKAAGKLLLEEGLGRRVPSGSAETEAGPYYQAILRKVTCRDIRKYVHLIYDLDHDLSAVCVHCF